VAGDIGPDHVHTGQVEGRSQRFIKPAVLWSGGGVETIMAVTKKRDVRRSVHQAGWITLDGGFAARPCNVRDLSTSGAKLVVEDPTSIGNKMRLAFSRDARTGRNCEVVWRRGKTLGVRFLG
jgi:hypothetical protein